MAITPSQKNGVTILRDLRDKLTQRTNVNNFDHDSKSRAISDAFTKEMVDVRQQSIQATEANQLSNSTGESLVQFGNSRGVPKRGNTFAAVSEAELSLAFYVESGTFGAINSAASIVVPEGTVVFTSPNNNELGATIRYRTTQSFTLDAAAALHYVSARAETSGDIANVGQGVLRNHEFTGYTDAANNSLKVINFYPILNGRRLEGDDQYRFRISQNYNRLHQNSDARILLTSLEVPGVLQVKPITGFFGIGTVGVVVLGADNQSNQSLVEQVQIRLNRFKGPAGFMQAIPATQSVFDLELEVKTSRAVNQQEQARLRAQIRRATTNYFRSIGLAGMVRFDALAKAIQTSTKGLVRLGAVGTESKLFKKIYVRRGFSNGVYSEREQIIANIHLLEEDEFADLGELDVAFV